LDTLRVSSVGSCLKNKPPAIGIFISSEIINAGNARRNKKTHSFIYFARIEINKIGPPVSLEDISRRRAPFSAFNSLRFAWQMKGLAAEF